MGKLSMVAFGGTLAVATATFADGIELTMQWTDSLTVEGTRYTCNGPARRGVAMGPGDKLTAGQFRLKCAKRGDGGAPDEPPPPPPPSARVSVISAVDTSCLTQLNSSISGRLPVTSATTWADACRPVAIGRSCSIDKSTPQSSCVNTLDSMISGSFSDDQVLALNHACARIEATCSPRGARKVLEATDMSCMSQLYQKTSGRPTAASIVKWIDGCRTPAPRGCTAVAASFESSCFSQSFTFITGRPSAQEAALIARGCMKIEYRCDDR